MPILIGVDEGIGSCFTDLYLPTVIPAEAGIQGGFEIYLAADSRTGILEKDSQSGSLFKKRVTGFRLPPE